MEDPAPLMEQQMGESTQVLALQASVKEGKRLLRQAIKERDLARAEVRRQLEQRMVERDLLHQARQRGSILLPKWLKNSIDNTLGAVK
jgi:hypothetical protein